MYKEVDKSHFSFLDFNQPLGLHMNPDNRWIKMADAIPWDVFEKKYSRLFKVKTGNVAISFEADNESTCLQEAVEHFKTRTGHYPERVLADQIYRTRDNRSFCKSKGTRLSGPRLGRPSAETIKSDKKTEYQDNTDRIEVEREFSLEKRCYGLGKPVTKLKETQLTSIALSVFVANLFKIQQRILYAFFYLFEIFTEYSAELSLKMA